VAGTLGGLVSTVALYPLELIKTRMQVAEASTRAAWRNPYGSVLGSLRLVVRNEGAAGLYQGLTPAIIASAGSWGGYFYFYEHSKSRKLAAGAAAAGGSGRQGLTTVDHLASGVEAGAILVLLFNPLWLVKTRLALQGVTSGPGAGTGAGAATAATATAPATSTAAAARYTGVGDALRTIVSEEGVAGLYKGVVPALFLTSHGAIQFAVYEWLKALSAAGGDGQQPAWVSVVIGGTSKIVASTATYPYQVVKARLQQREAPGGLAAPRYSGMLDCVAKTWRLEGGLGFFRGVVPNALKVAPSAALTFVVYEEVLKLLALAGGGT
jgi:solute carrier family 25 folate transporter 32